ncbi:MAG: RNA chaperone Hfq [Thermodesulfobacteriota bacterium]
MVKNQINIQDQFLNRIRRDKIHVTIDLVNGQKVEGIIISFDNFSLILRGENDQLIYKHAISSISLGQKLDLMEPK